MAKAKKVEFGIEITKPWSKEMYAHNDEVQEVVVGIITKMWRDEMATLRSEWEEQMEDEEFEADFEEAEWSHFNDGILSDIQTAVTCYGFLNYSVVDVEQIGKSKSKSDSFIAHPLRSAPISDNQIIWQTRNM